MHCKRCGRENLETSSFCSACGYPTLSSFPEPGGNTRRIQNSSQDPLSFAEGEIFAGRYRMVAEIGRGGMGRVYRAVDLELEVEVAVKVIRPEFLDDERMVRRFRNEILLAREVTHENVVRIHDFAESEGIQYITMQYVEGRTLRSHLSQSGPLSITEIELLAGQICRGLEAARKKGIAHRDLKPQNILVDTKGQAYIADFGLARGQGQSGVSLTGVILGTPEYISPEQWKGQRGDFRSDIYSLGVTLYEMATGRHLFQADSEFGYLQKHLTETPAFGVQDTVRIPEYLRRVILRCLEKDPDVRYQSVDEVENDLKAQKASSAPLRLKLKKTVKKTLKPLMILVLLVVLSFAVYRLLTPSGSFEGPERLRVAVLPFENRTGEERLAFWSNALADLLTTDLGQSRYLQLVPQAQVQHYVQHRETDGKTDQTTLPELRKLTGAEYALLGEFHGKGERYRIKAWVITTGTGTKSPCFFLDGLGEESLFGMIDSLTVKVKKNFHLPREVVVNDLDRDIRLLSTSSVEALRLYTEARKFYNTGQYEEAVQRCQDAVKADPDFVMAYVQGALYLRNMKRFEQSRELYQKAMGKLGNISRREAQIVEASYKTLFMYDFDGALQIYRRLVQDYPDDEEGWEAIAYISRNMERWPDALEAYGQLRRINPLNQNIGANVMYIHLLRGEYDKALEVLELYKNELDNPGYYRVGLFHIYLRQGRLDRAAEALDELNRVDPDGPLEPLLRGHLALLSDRFDEAERWYRVLQKPVLGRRNLYQAYENLINLALHRGQFGLARTLLQQADASELASEEVLELELEELHCRTLLQTCMAGKGDDILAEELNAGKRDLSGLDFSHRQALEYLYGRLYLVKGEIQEVNRMITSMKGYVVRRGEAFRRYALHLQAETALQQGQPKEALVFARQAVDLLPNPGRPDSLAADFLQTLARIETALGHLDEAMHLYRDIIDGNIGRLDNATSWVMAHVELARLCLRNGRKSEAETLAKRVVDWWQKGDPAPQILKEMKGMISGDRLSGR